MRETTEQLLQGNASVPRYYEAAKRKWDDFFETHRGLGVGEWARWLTDEQISFFEHRCGGRDLGQEIMAFSGFGALYNRRTGFEGTRELAKKLAEAFEGSGVSLEVKSLANKAAKSYDLDEN